MTSPFRNVEVSDPAYEVEGLREVTVASPALGRRGDVTVWAPPGADGPLPLVVLLHGVYGSHWAWARSAGAHRTAARLVATGEVGPLALAMPSDGLWGQGSGYLPRAGEDSEAWVLDDVPRAARCAVPGAGLAGLFLVGLSMGGFGALRLAAVRPDAVRGAVGLSSITRVEDFTGFVDSPLSAYADPAGRTGDLAELLPATTGLPALRLDCGRDDPLLAGNRRVHDALVRAGVPHDYEEHPGAHDWGYWTTRLPDALRFVERVRAAGDHPGASNP